MIDFASLFLGFALGVTITAFGVYRALKTIAGER